GTYRLTDAITPLALLKKLNDGDVVTIALTFVEGVTFADMRAQLESAKDLQITLSGVSNKDILKKIGAGESSAEGLFFPDTYRFSAGTTDLELLKKSYRMMQQKLALAWAQRDPSLPYKEPYDALIMASIIEKETGRAEERPLIGAVFTNRLKIPMRLQTDPTVIYGMGQRFDGNIRRRDLTTDTPYNTYTRDGLPPTPIAMPGWGALLAAVKPAQTDKLYFVAKGDGSHYFSRSLDEHNRAVAKYQLGK
ncbi:MAG: endolytic transglycosylase MltG, partial [Burkholderiales bacterium]|nr:endolytic transglycosylase MltG [Burkholderiales bacterium]